MTVAELTKKMIEYSNGNLHDIAHFMKVYGYAKTIGECEGLDSDTQKILEIAALVHDIAIPLCREKYGNTNGKNQELEGPKLVFEFLEDSGLSDQEKNRIAYLVGHHHTLTGIAGMDYQILIEADYLVNADESAYSKVNIQNMLEKVFRTPTGCALLKSMYQM